MTALPTGIARRLAGAAALVLIAGGLLAACGKEGPPKAPSGGEAPYPRTYPAGVDEPSEVEAQ